MIPEKKNPCECKLALILGAAHEHPVAETELIWEPGDLGSNCGPTTVISNTHELGDLGAFLDS